MTREEAKEILTHNWTRVDNPNYSESELDEAFFMAIEALHHVEAEEKGYCHRIIPSNIEVVVRCKDCFWFDQNIYRNCFRNRREDEYAEWGVCTKLSHNMKVNDYCSCGEREAPYKGGDTE